MKLRDLKKRMGHVGMALGALALLGGAHAENADVSPAVSAKLKASLKERYPDLVVEQVHRAPLPGLYEVVLNDQIIYSDEAASYLLVGRLVESKTKEDVSAKRWNEYNRIDFATLPLDLAIKTVKGDGSRTLALFEDPQCPYCKQLEQQLATITNVTVYTFLFPLESIHPGATESASRIWCSKDPAAAWSNWMLHQTEPDPKSAACDAQAVSKVLALGGRLRVNSTPTFFFADGERGRGAQSAEQLEQALQSIQSKQAAAAQKSGTPHHS